MHITIVTNDYDSISSSNYTDCTNNENKIDIIRPTLLFKIPCGLSFLCLMSLMVYTLTKPLFNKKYKINTYKYPSTYTIV